MALLGIGITSIRISARNAVEGKYHEIGFYLEWLKLAEQMMFHCRNISGCIIVCIYKPQGGYKAFLYRT
ncbi:hypothetical protein D3C76_1514420 [compost metagenome]